MQTPGNRGYLHEPYRLFHSTDQRDADFDTHYHEFHKLIFCLSGGVTYTMEGRIYALEKGDLLIIPARQMHKSTLRATEKYERMILWISDSFLRGQREPAPAEVFEACRHFRPGDAQRSRLLDLLLALERCPAEGGPGAGLLADTYLIQFLVMLRRLTGADIPAEAPRRDPLFEEILAYINGHLSADLSVSALAGRFFVSPSRLMHAFKNHAGCTLHRYVVQKRLLWAADRIREGAPVLTAAREAGFADYSSFLKAFRRQYDCAPGQLRKP